MNAIHIATEVVTATDTVIDEGIGREEFEKKNKNSEQTHRARNHKPNSKPETETERKSRNSLKTRHPKSKRFRTGGQTGRGAAGAPAGVPAPNLLGFHVMILQWKPAAAEARQQA